LSFECQFQSCGSRWPYRKTRSSQENRPQGLKPTLFAHALTRPSKGRSSTVIVSVRGRWGILYYYTAFHYPFDMLELGDVGERVAFYCDEVGVSAGLERAYFVFPSH